MIATLVAKLEYIREILSTSEFWIGAAAGAILLAGIWACVLRRRLRATQVALNLPFGLGNITYEATDYDRVIAWKMYLQLKTRKAALPFDEKNDVIIEVFDSLHEIFPITRVILSELKPHKGEAQKSIADFILRVLNDGVRPLLTRWHAKYQMWWSEATNAPEHKGKFPQEVQCLFPQYTELTTDLRRMNDELAKYAEELLTIVHTSPTRRRNVKKAAVEPEQPYQQSRPKPPGDIIVAGQVDLPIKSPPNKEMS